MCRMSLYFGLCAVHRCPVTFSSNVDAMLARLRMQVSFVLASARDPDMPIVYASGSFYDLTGYSPAEVLGPQLQVSEIDLTFLWSLTL